MSDKARDRVEQVVEQALRAYGDYDPNAVDSIVGRIVDALLAHGPALDGGSYRAGWLFRYGKVHDVTETDTQDHHYIVYTRDLDPDDPDRDDEDGDEG